MTTQHAVLIVEDNPITRKMVRLALETEGMRVFEAADAKTAVEIAARERLDVILQDLLLPDATGFDVLKKLQALPAAREIPVLAFTGFLSRDEEARVVDAGFDGLLVKPIAPSQLVLALRPYLSGAGPKKRKTGRGRSVLLVDDDPTQLKLANLFLLHAGFEVRTATNGKDALAEARRSPPELIVSDVLMPRMDGFQFCAAVRTDPALSRVPVVLQTTKFVDEADRRLGRLVGAQEFVQRSPDARTLIAATERALAATVRPAPPEAWDALRQEYLSRVVAQLERQAAANAGLVQRASVLGASLSVLAAISTSLAERVADGGSQFSLEEILHHCVEAAGLSRGAVFLREEAGAWSLAASLGFGARKPEALDALVQEGSVLGHLSTERRTIIAPSGDLSPDDAHALLATLAASSVIVASLPSAGGFHGALLLTSADRDLSGPEWRAFAETVAANLGQALALSGAVGALAASETRYRLLFEGSPIAKYVSTPEGRLVDANPALVTLLGYPDKAALMPVGIQSHYANPEERRTWMERVREQRHVQDFECELHKLDGTSVWVLLSALAVVDANGELMRYEGALVDITERRHALQALRESEERFREIADNVREVFFINDPSTGRTLYVNRSWESMFGQSVAYALATPLAFIEQMHPDDRERLTAAAKGANADAKRMEFTYRLVRPGGEIRWIRATTTNISDASGQVIRQVGVAEDITELKRTQDQYVHSQKMEAVGLLAGGIAHDFNNLLTVIKSYGAFLLDEVPASNPHRELIEEIATAGDRAAALTRQLLAFSRRQVVDLRLLDLNVILGDLDKMLRRIVTERIEFRTSLSGDLGTVRGDAGQLEQVVVNLVVNARDAMPDGGELDLSTEDILIDDAGVARTPGARAGRWVRLRVRDTGTGMDADTRARMFEPFFTTKERGRGTGLGLSTTFGIVEQSGGFILVDTAPGRGTTFDIHLPRLDEPPEGRGAAAAGIARRGGDERILLVEDDDAVRGVVARTLNDLGYTVTEARNGAEALGEGRSAAEPPDLVVTDVVMPKMSGRELVRRLRELWPAVRVLYMSGYSDEAIDDPDGLGADAVFVEKPFRADQLALKVRAALDRPTP